MHQCREELPIDHYYQCAVRCLKESCAWKDHTDLQEWLIGMWLGIPARTDRHCASEKQPAKVDHSSVACFEYEIY